VGVAPEAVIFEVQDIELSNYVGRITVTEEGNPVAEVSFSAAQLIGVIGEVNCGTSSGILTGATVDLYKDATHVATTESDGDGNYSLPVAATGDYEVRVNKSGFREETQAINIASLGPQYELDFLGETGLIPNAPETPYVVVCIHYWLHPELGCVLSTPKVVAVIHAWLFPV